MSPFYLEESEFSSLFGRSLINDEAKKWGTVVGEIKVFVTNSMRLAGEEQLFEENDKFQEKNFGDPNNL